MAEELDSIPSPFGKFCFNVLSPLPVTTPMRLPVQKDQGQVSPQAWSITPMFTLGRQPATVERQLAKVDFSESRSFQAAEMLVKVIREDVQPALVEASRPVNPDGCNCSRSQCLKMYCECFAAKRYCTGCRCDHCCNVPEFESRRQDAISIVLEKNPMAFQPKVAGDEQPRHQVGCNCKKSGCVKKYCECFQRGAVCCDLCRCVSCENNGEKRKKQRRH